jgi:predicted dehydrogenase
MYKLLNEAYVEITNIVESGRIGIPQICVLSVNDHDCQQNSTKRMETELALLSRLIGNSTLKNEERLFNPQPYIHGFVAREYENGAIIRYAYTAAPSKNITSLNVYGTNGEIRFDTETGEILVFKQIPDHQGEPLLY